MSKKDIQDLIDMLRDNEDMAEIEVSKFLGGQRIRVSRQGAAAAAAVAPQPQPATASPTPEPKAPAVADGLIEIKAPMVGTFYHAPSPDADPFVQEGSQISPGSVLCIIEAMKLMNEIEAETSGTVREILVQNGEPIEFGQPLFLIEQD